MCRVTAQWRRSPRRATNAMRPAISRVTAPRINLVEDQVVATAVEVGRQTPSATSVVKSAILRGHAMRLLLAAAAEEEEEEDTAAEEDLVVVEEAKLGEFIP